MAKEIYFERNMLVYSELRIPHKAYLWLLSFSVSNNCVIFVIEIQ